MNTENMTRDKLMSALAAMTATRNNRPLNDAEMDWESDLMNALDDLDGENMFDADRGW